jgi:hypothetical protein
MELVFALAAVAAVVVAVWLQRATSMARGYAWLSRLVAAVFALLFVPTLVANPNVATLAQAVVLTCVPLILVPYQVRMMQLISRSKSSATASGAQRGPGGGRVRSRGRGRANARRR